MRASSIRSQRSSSKRSVMMAENCCCSACRLLVSPSRSGRNQPRFLSSLASGGPTVARASTPMNTSDQLYDTEPPQQDALTRQGDDSRAPVPFSGPSRGSGSLRDGTFGPETPREHPGRPVGVHRHPIEPVGDLHTPTLVGDHDELCALLVTPHQ